LIFQKHQVLSTVRKRVALFDSQKNSLKSDEISQSVQEKSHDEKGSGESKRQL